MSVAVIQGASGALGQALARNLLSSTSLKVYALTHRKGNDLHQVLSEGSAGASDRLSVLDGVDVREEDTLDRAASTISEREGKGNVRLVACLAGIVRAKQATLGD